MTLSDTARSILTEARQHPLGLAAPPSTLPAAAQNTVLRSLLKQDLLVESTEQISGASLGWRRSDGTLAAMQITDAGRQAVGADEPRNAVDEAELGGLTEAEYDAEQEAAQRALDAGINLAADDAYEQAVAAGVIPTSALAEPHSESSAAPAPVSVGDDGTAIKAAGGAPMGLRGASGRPGLRDAARILLAAWDTPNQLGLSTAIETLRGSLAPHRAPPNAGTPRQPRQDTKQATVLALLRRPEGASGPQLIETTSWAPHTVRGFLAGLGRKGIAVEVLGRIRQVGPNKAGAKGSYTIYRIADAG